MLDREIRREDVQTLSNRDQVVAFFAALGYQTDARLAQTPANIGVTADSLTRQITHSSASQTTKVCCRSIW